MVPTRHCGASLWSRVATDPYDRRKGQNRKVSSNTSEGQWRENVRGRGNAGNAAGSRGNPSSERGLSGYLLLVHPHCIEITASMWGIG